MAGTVPVHYLRPNEGEWSPKSVAFFDTETTPQEVGTDEVHVLRLWCGDAFRRDDDGRRHRDGARSDGASGRSLAEWLSAQCVGVSSTWCFAHNLSFDLTTTRLLDHLGDLGWTVSQFGSTDRCPWFRLTRRSKRLTLTDSWSWLSTSLQSIGDTTGVRKPDLPDWSDDDETWKARCYGDVDTLAAAVLTLMDWWDRQGLGRWSITGASTGWNAMRHKLDAPRILIDPNPAGVAFEREAVRGGRRDTWRFGEVRGGHYLELDIERAHGTTAEHLTLPTKRIGYVAHLPPEHRLWTYPDVDVILRAKVRTDRPRWPLRHSGATWWPVGEFWTVLAGPELRRARELGDLVETGEGYVYGVGRSLARWGKWVNRVASGEEPTTPPVARLLAKSWTRSVVGKWAGHKSTTTLEGTALHPSWNVDNVIPPDATHRVRLVTLGDDCWRVEMGGDADNAFPAVLAWVESYERVAMQTMITALGQELVIHCDTDGMIVDLEKAVRTHPELRKRGHRLQRPESMAQLVCDWLTTLVPPYRVRPKSLVSSLCIVGPQQLWLDDRKRLSGIKSDAEVAEDGKYVYRAWPKLYWQMRTGSPDGYVRPEVRMKRPVNTTHRWVLADDTTWPVRARVTAEGANEIVPWEECREDAPSPLLWREQHPVLEGLRE